MRYGIQDAKYRHDAESIQRLVEGQNLDIRKFLVKYESVIEGQRQRIQERRQAILTSDLPDLERIGVADDHRRSLVGPPGRGLRVARPACSGIPGAGAIPCTST